MTRTAHQLVEAGLTAVWGRDWLAGGNQELSEADITARFGAFAQQHRDQIQRQIDRRDDLSTTPLAVFRRFLAFIGLKLARRQIMREGERFMVYRLDPGHAEVWHAYAQARLAHLAAQDRITSR